MPPTMKIVIHRSEGTGRYWATIGEGDEQRALGQGWGWPTHDEALKNAIRWRRDHGY